MAMNLRSGSGAGDPEVMMDINTTPLIDVMLVLLVMLIITIPIQLHSVNLDMPVGTPPSSSIKPEKIQIDIDENSVVYWQGQAVSAEELEAKNVIHWSIGFTARGAYPAEQGFAICRLCQCPVHVQTKGTDKDGRDWK